MITRIAGAMLFGALLLSPGFVSAEDDASSLEQMAIEMADTPEQHTVLARHFRAKAETAREEVRRHEQMRRTYSGGTGKTTGRMMQRRQEMSRHCKNLSEKYAAMAEEYEQLAKLHEEEAKTAE